MYADDPSRLQHILDSAVEAVRYTESFQRDNLDANSMLYRAMKDCLATIGEAAFKLTRDFRDLHPDVDWKALIRHRNDLVHDYSVINRDHLRSTAKDSLPELIPRIERLMQLTEQPIADGVP